MLFPLPRPSFPIDSAGTCPFAKAWVDSASAGAASAHSYAECSNHGTCDRDSGECECSDGFEGRACDRVACPSGCSGKGTCEYVGGSSWDSSKTRACKCDPGFGGIDCSAPLCPLGDDIMTTLTDPTQAATTDVQEAEVQSVAVVSRGAPMNSGNVTFTYTDLYGGSWTTRPILLPVAKAYVNTNEYVAGTATGAGTTATEDIKMGASLTDTTSTKSAQAGTYYPVGSATATNEGGYAGLSGTSTTGSGSSNTHFWRVKEYARADQEITVVGGGLTATTSSTTFALLGGKKTTAANWGKLDLASAACELSATNDKEEYCQFAHVSDMGTTAADGMYKHTIAVSSSLQAYSDLTFALRKGDWIFVGEDRGVATDAGAGCLMQVAKDYLADGEDGILYTVADDSTAPCLLGQGNYPYATTGATGASTKTAIYALWKPFAPEGARYDTSSKKVTAFDAAAGTLTVDAAFAAGDLYRALLPGMWIRLYYANAPDAGYCDMQLNHFTRATASEQMNDSGTTLYVDPASPTSTNGDQSLCNSFSYNSADIGQPHYRHPNSQVGLAYLPNAVVLASANAYKAATNTQTFAVATSGTVATITQSTQFSVEDGAALVVGALAYLVYDAGANDQFYCACTVSASPIVGNSANSGASAFTCTAPPATIAGATVTSCVGKTLSATGGLRVAVFAQNGIYYQHGMTDALNSKKFEDIAVGDTVRVSNVFQNTDGTNKIKSSHSATFEVFNKDPATSAATSVFFQMGSKPNGGGMYPAIGLLRSDTDATTGKIGGGLTDADTDTGMPIAELDHSVWFGSTMVMQPVDSAGNAWTASDAACVQSAKDVKRVLEELPNRVVEEVSVSMTANTLGKYAYTVTFSGARNSGNQNPLMMNSKGCNLDGCQPRYSGVAVQRAWAADDIAIAAGAVTSADQADLTGVVAAAGGETLLFYQKGAMTGKTAPNMYATTAQIVTDGLSTAVAAEPTSVMVLKNVGDTDSATNAKLFESVTTEIKRGTTEATECSGRGSCESDGTCACYEGYKGDACHQQSALV